MGCLVDMYDCPITRLLSDRMYMQQLRGFTGGRRMLARSAVIFVSNRIAHRSRPKVARRSSRPLKIAAENRVNFAHLTRVVAIHGMHRTLCDKFGNGRPTKSVVNSTATAKRAFRFDLSSLAIYRYVTIR